MNKILQGLCLCVGVVSLMELVSVPIYAMPNGYTEEELDAKQKAEGEAVKDLPHDILLPSEKSKVPQDGDAGTLNVGWTNADTGIYYCKDENRIKVSGWQQINNKWYYFNPSTYDMKTGWLNYGGKWYYLLEATHVNKNYLNPKDGLLGTMQTEWLRDNDKIYYFNQNGVMQTGWVLDSGKWYYFNQDGSMAVDTTIDGYKIGSDGAWISTQKQTQKISVVYPSNWVKKSENSFSLDDNGTALQFEAKNMNELSEQEMEKKIISQIKAEFGVEDVKCEDCEYNNINAREYSFVQKSNDNMVFHIVSFYNNDVVYSFILYGHGEISDENMKAFNTMLNTAKI